MRRTLLLLFFLFSSSALLYATPNDSLLSAIRQGDLNGVQRWIDQPGVDVNYGEGVPIYLASNSKNTEIVRSLLNRGAILEGVAIPSGITPMHNAAAYGPDEMLKLMLEHGGSANSVDNTGATPLHWAAAVGAAGRAKLLSSVGATLDLRTKAGFTAWNIATLWNRKDVADFLKKQGANTDPPPPLTIHGPYLGENPPGDQPQRFPESLMAAPFANHGPLRFSKDGRELIGSQNAAPVGGIWTMRESAAGWSAQAVLPFTREHHDAFPVLGPDEDVLYFHSTRPPGGEQSGVIWFSKRTSKGWGDPEMLDLPTLPGRSLVPCSISDDGWLYGYTYGENVPGIRGGTDVFRVNLKASHPEIELLGSPVNSDVVDIEPIIAPDGSYLLIASNRPAEGVGRIGLFVSYRMPDGSWSEPAVLGPSINTQGGAWRAFITRDGKYLFFQRAWDQYYWVSTSVIEAKRP